MTAVGEGTVPDASDIRQPPGGKSNDAILFLEARIRQNPDDFIAYNKVASEYLQRSRETGDVAFIELALKAAGRSLAILPPEQNKGGLAVLAQSQFASHDFLGARQSAERLTQIDPGRGYVYQLLGDAQLELGEYDEARASFDQMDKLGGVQAITQAAIEQRLGRMAFITGDLIKAKAHYANSLKLARSMPEPPRETVAWCLWQMGEISFMAGEYEKAQAQYHESLTAYPDYYRSLASLGRVRAAVGDMYGAIDLYEKVAGILPDPSYVAALGDLYRLQGRDTDAERQYELVQNIGKLSALNGVLYSRQLASFYADHDMLPEDAYSAAVHEYEVRKDIYGADAVAWTALKAGKLPEALAASRESQRLGTRDPRLLYHAGMIAYAAGDTKEAKRLLSSALKMSPGFDPLQSKVARERLEALG